MIDCIRKIDFYYKEEAPFVLYHSPNSEELVLLKGKKEDILECKEIGEINKKSGFLFIPFFITDENPILVFSPREENSFSLQKESLKDGFTIQEYESNKNVQISEAYIRDFSLFKEKLSSKNFKKIVLARESIEEVKQDLKLSEIFIKMLASYPSAYTYIAYTPKIGVWLGASPELFLLGKDLNWETTSLAGTQVQEGEGSIKWSQKNKEEQSLVTDFIRKTLEKYSTNIKEENVHSFRINSIAHLKTNFSFQLKNAKDISLLIKDLFPTPAVCGLPQKESYEFIRKNETCSRNYYSGLVGNFNKEEISHLYVNLRCVNIKNKKLTLYAGGGLLEESDLKEEFLETERKMDVMRRVLNKIEEK